MGTRSTTKVFDSDKLLVTLYCQFDGYPSGVGLQLAEFIKSRPFVNGISGDTKVFNGMGCFAAQLIAHLKDRAGLWYVKSPEADNEEYDYEIRGGWDFATETGKPVTLSMRDHGENAFTGSADEFIVFAAAEQD